MNKKLHLCVMSVAMLVFALPASVQLNYDNMRLAVDVLKGKETTHSME